MKNTKTNVRRGTTLNLHQTTTTDEGFTTLAKTDNEEVNVALSYLEDALSGLYYYALERDNVGSDPLNFAKSYLATAVEVLEELKSD